MLNFKHSNDDGIGLFKLYYKMRLPKKRNINTVKRIFYRKGDTKWKFEVYVYCLSIPVMLRYY